MFRKTRRKKASRVHPFRLLIIGAIFGVFIGMAMGADAQSSVGPLPYPLSVGDTFTHNGNDCITLYSWSDDLSAVAACHTHNGHRTLAYDAASNRWSKWNGCMVFKHGHWTGRRMHSLLRCYGHSRVEHKE